jgi:hypothetical protein
MLPRRGSGSAEYVFGTWLSRDGLFVKPKGRPCFKGLIYVDESRLFSPWTTELLIGQNKLRSNCRLGSDHNTSMSGI